MTMTFNPGLSTELIANGGCFRCGNPNDLVDFGVEVHLEGVLCICRPCVLEAAGTLGEQLMQAHIMDELAQVKALLERTQASLRRKEELFAELSETATMNAAQREVAEAEWEHARRQRIENGQDPDTGRFLTKEEKTALLEAASTDA